MLNLLQTLGWTAWPLLACSVAAIAIIIERLYALAPSKIAPAKLLPGLMDATRGGAASADLVAKLEASSAMGAVFASGLRCAFASSASTPEQWARAMETAGKEAAQSLERRLAALATIASAAPLLGLFGTVIGMIQIFSSQASAVGNPAELAHGISVALYNTAFGLLVAIPSLIFWRYFRSRVDEGTSAMEVGAERLVEHLRTARPAIKRGAP